MAINIELENLYFSDKKEREGLNDRDNKAIEELQKKDRIRLARIKEILHLALLFQHGETIEDYENAHKYAKEAVKMGSNVTKWLYTATLDRWLISQGKPQNFGTQFRIID